jgi:hypothetical protein
MRRLNQFAVGDDGRVFETIAQLADIAGPVIGTKVVQRRTGKSGQRLPQLAAEDPQEVVGQLGDILPPLPKGGKGQGKGVEAVKEIQAKGTLPATLFEIAMGGNDDAEICRLRLIGADLFIDPFFQETQEFGLERQGHIADLVEKQGAGAGAGAFSFPLPVGAGEGPLTWPNNSLSSKLSGIAAQLTGTKVVRSWPEARWMARASTSFPTPLSP